MYPQAYIKNNIENSTCLSNLRYTARAAIRTDNIFKREVLTIKRKAEQDYLKLLIRFDYPDNEELQKELKHRKSSVTMSRSCKTNCCTCT